MWAGVAAYFEEGAAHDDGNHMHNGIDSGIGNSPGEGRFPVDEASWTRLISALKSPPLDALLTSNVAGDPESSSLYMLARFATGVSSPRLQRLRLTRHPLFGSMAHCDWPVVLSRARAVFV